MTNPYLEYYSNQAGSGLAGFQGYRYQRGHGFFGNLFQNILKPLGKYLGKQALKTGVEIGGDMMSGENFKTSAKKRLKSTKDVVLNDAIDRAKLFAQTGKGRKRRRRRRKGNKKQNNFFKKMKVRKTRKRKCKKRKKSVKKRKPKSKHLRNIF